MKLDCNMGLRALILMLLGLTLAACSNEESVENLDPVAFHGDDTCHVCGMAILDFPGPKGQAVERNDVKKFCSTAELLSWHLQPENRILQARLYVHDMAQSEWDAPDDDHLVDATTAFYVTGIPLQGAMGASFATFADESSAQALADEHGGRVLRFDEIDQELLQQAASTQHGHMEHGGH